MHTHNTPAPYTSCLVCPCPLRASYACVRHMLANVNHTRLSCVHTHTHKCMCACILQMHAHACMCREFNKTQRRQETPLATFNLTPSAISLCSFAGKPSSQPAAPRQCFQGLVGSEKAIYLFANPTCKDLLMSACKRQSRVVNEREQRGRTLVASVLFVCIGRELRERGRLSHRQKSLHEA